MTKQRYVAFLRAINVKNRYVKMEALREALASLNFEYVETYIQSGNVIFETAARESADIESEIEIRLKEAFGFDVPTMVRSAETVRTISQREPFGERKDNVNLYVSFLKSLPDDSLCEKLYTHANEIDQYLIEDGQLYWRMNRAGGNSKMTNARVERILKTAATRRNVTSVRKLVAKHLS